MNKYYIYKYELDLRGEGTIHFGGNLKKILHIAEQGNADNEDSKLMLWAIVEPASKTNSYCAYEICGTGQTVSPAFCNTSDDHCYRQTVLMSSGYVWHCVVYL